MAKNKANMKKFVTGAITATMVASAVAPVAALADTVDFSDVPTDSSHYPNIVKAAERGLMTGYADGTFKPTLTMNRGQVVKALGKYIVGQEDITLDAYLEKHDLVKNVAAFEDVPATHVDQELFKYSLVVKDAQAFTGNQNYLNPTNDITRQQMAKVLVNAFDLKDISDVEADVADMDTVFGEYKEYVSILSKHEVTKADDGKFRPAESVTRQQMASFLNRSYDAVHEDKTPEVPGVEGITSVKAINDTRYEVTFGTAFDKDVAREIEKEPGRIIAFHGGETENSDDVLVAETVTFDSANKVATVTFDKAPTTDINYTVALMDNEDNKAANIVSKSTPQVLVKGAETPTVDVNAAQDKVVIDFKQKMDEEALDIANYTLYDDKGNELDALGVYAEVDATKATSWKDATTKQAVEFKLKPDGLLEAGKTYKIVVNEDVVNDDGDKLAANKRTVNFKTPSISEARPEAKFATVIGDTIEINFDKDLDQGDVNLTKLVKVKTATGKEVKLKDVKVDGDKKLVVEADETLDKTSSYTVTLPENVVASAYFYNALNKSVNIKAEAQEDVIVKSMKAAFEVDAKTKTEANLVLTFDQNVTQELGGSGDLEIRVDGKTYKLDSGADIEYGKNGKELRVKNVKTAFLNGSDGLVIENGKSYEVVAKAGAVQTDSELAPTNKDELKTTISSNVDVTAPQVDRMELVSANEIVLTFDKDIKGTVKAKDVTAEIILIDRNGGIDSTVDSLGDENYIKVTTSGKKMTIKAADDKVKFVTGDSQKVTIKENAFKGSNDIENEEIEVTSDTTPGEADTSASNDFVFVDNAAPEIIGAQVGGTDSIVLTYSENIKTLSSSEKDIASQFTFDGTEIKNYGTTVATVLNDTVTVTFTPATSKNVFDAKDYPNLKIKYSAKAGHDIFDENDNKAKAQTKTGASKQ